MVMFTSTIKSIMLVKSIKELRKMADSDEIYLYVRH